jgi:C4-dicarboxylate-specific signal transduction histidine kinase
MTDFSFESVLSDGKKREMLIARLPIHNLDLSFVAWMPSEQIVGTLAPWHLIAGMGSLAVFVLAGLGLIIWFTTQNLILRVRFDESERQHDLLAAKNLRLKEEIQKRQEAEEELKAQRTLLMRSDRLRSLGEMAAGIAHELNQPLVGVRGFAELILHSMDNGLEISKDVIRSNTGTIVEQADRMVHIINHVRLFARDADSVETSIVDLNDVVRSGTSMLMAQFNSHGLLLENDLSPHELPVKVNPYSVEEVIFNLLSNARHSLGKKKETAGDEYRPCVHVITRKIAANGRDVVTLKIADNGTGIPGHAAEKIFDPFFTTKDPDKGTGLGLSICKSIVESFQGQIQFDTAENEGTSFEIVFPKH